MRRIFLALAVLLFLAGVGMWTMTRPWFLRWQIEPALARALGGDVDLGDVRYGGGGRFVLSDVRLLAPGHSGEAAAVLFVESAEVTVDLNALLDGDITLRDAEIDGLRLRVSEQVDAPGRFNFQALSPAAGTTTGAELPRVTIRSARIEMGTHDGGTFSLSGSRRVAGELRPLAPAEGWYEFELREIDKAGSDRREAGLHSSGRFNALTLEHTGSLSGMLELDQNAYGLFPLAVRRWLDEMHLSGRVSNVSVHWSAALPLEASMRLQAVDLTLPILPEGWWARYRDGEVLATSERPRMYVEAGTIEVRGTRLSLTGLTGLLSSTAGVEAGLVQVPYQVDLDIGPLPEIDWQERQAWTEQVLSSAPFDLTLRIEDFAVEPDVDRSAPGVELPSIVANALSQFAMTTWSIDTELTVRRGVSVDGAASETRSGGWARIRDAAGAYRRFAYPLREVSADLSFSDLDASIDLLTGVGPDGATVEMSGTIRPVTREGEIRLRIDANNVLVDSNLRGALQPHEQEAFDMLFSSASFDRLMALGAVPEGGIERWRPSGRANLKLSIDRPAGPGQRTVTTGKIALQPTTLVYRDFPYPIQLQGGELNWLPGEIQIAGVDNDGEIPFAMPGGGTGSLRGSIGLPTRDSRKLRPDLTLRFAADAMNPMILAAIPASVREDDGPRLHPTARLLSQFNMTGSLHGEGRISTAQDGTIDYAFPIWLDQGEAHPSKTVITEEAAFRWPQSLTLTELAASMLIDREGVVLTELIGRHPFGEVSGQGSINPRDDSASSISFRLTDLPVEPTLIAEAAPDLAEAMDEAWQAGLTGRFAARVDYRGGGAEPAVELSLEPQRLELQIGERPLSFDHRAGEVKVHEAGVSWSGLQMEVASLEQRAGTITFSGHASDTESVGVEGLWEGGLVESPLVHAVVEAAGGEAAIDEFDALGATGSLDAKFEYDSVPEAGEPPFRLTLFPKSLAVNWSGERLAMLFEQDASLRYVPGRVTNIQLPGRAADGATFDIRGSLGLEPDVVAELVLSYAGDANGHWLRTLLPAGVTDALEAIGFESGTLDVRGADLHIGPGVDGGVRTSFDAVMQTSGAIFDPGLRFEDLDGVAELNVIHQPSLPLQLALGLKPKRFQMLGQEFASGRIDLHREADGRIVLDEAWAGLAGGRATCDGWFGGDGEAYEAAIRLAGVSIGLLDLTEQDDTGEPRPEESRSDDREGTMDAMIHLAGAWGAPETRRGRGMLLIVDGRIAEVPLGVPILQQLNLPLFRNPLEEADASFYISGDRIIFPAGDRQAADAITLKSDTLRLEGYGTMGFEDYELDLRFKSFGSVPVVSDLIDELNNRLFEIQVTGTLRQPDTRLVRTAGAGAGN